MDLPGQITALLHGQCSYLLARAPLSTILSAFVSMRRIETFLAECEVEDWASSLKQKSPDQPATPTSEVVGFRSASFEWSAPDSSGDVDREPFVLKDLTIQFPSGKLSLITGATGSGKSSLLNALLGGKRPG